MTRVRTDFISGTITDNPLAIGATTINAAALASLPVIAAPDIAVLILDPAAAAPEIVHVTAHTGSATSATISRGQEGSAAKEHASGTAFVHGGTSDDFASNLSESAQNLVGAGYYKQFFALGPAASVHLVNTTAANTRVGVGCVVWLDASGVVRGVAADQGADAGAWEFVTGATSGADAGVVGPSVANDVDWTLVWRGKFPSNAALNTAFVGQKVITGATFADGSNLIGFRVLTTGNLVGVCDSGGTETTRDTGAVGTTEMTLRIEVRSGGTIVRFYKDGTQVGADVTTNIPTPVANTAIAAGLINNTTTSVTMVTHDLFGWREV